VPIALNIWDYSRLPDAYYLVADQPYQSGTPSRWNYRPSSAAHCLILFLASTILNEEGFDGDVIEACLAHTGKNEVRNAYNRATYLDRRKPVMQWWSDHIEKAATGDISLTGKKGLKIVNR